MVLLVLAIWRLAALVLELSSKAGNERHCDAQ
jgi:hypothetical protein